MAVKTLPRDCHGVNCASPNSAGDSKKFPNFSSYNALKISKYVTPSVQSQPV